MEKKYVIFGAGCVGKQALHKVGRKHVAFFVDNDKARDGTFWDGIPVRWYANADLQEKLRSYKVLIAVSDRYLRAIEFQLDSCGIKYTSLQSLLEVEREENEKKILEKILRRPDYLNIYNRAIDWIKSHNFNGQCMINNTALPEGCSRVTGNYIPTLLQWGYREMAASFGKWLCDIQKADGCWYDINNIEPCVFDSGQILKGLIAIKKSMRETGLKFAYEESILDEHIIGGVDWILSNMYSDGHLAVLSEASWSDKRIYTELVHIDCLQPIMEAAEIYGCSYYRTKTQEILAYYVKNYHDSILNFDQFSHFYFCIIEALVDLGETDIAGKVMERMAVLQDKIGFVPAYPEVHWCCSTGLFQQALVWFKLGDREHGEKAFKYALGLQNISGGWYGSYPNPKYPDEIPEYFPNTEVSWAIKYFLDALYWNNRTDFDVQSGNFRYKYPKLDGRYQEIYQAVNAVASCGGRYVLDVGCGKGAYLRNLLQDVPELSYAAVDISTTVMTYISETNIDKKQGSLTQIPFPDDMFDFTYATGALEHAIDIESAVREMCRVTKPNGIVCVLDHNKKRLGCLEIWEWEQWFDIEELRNLMGQYCIETWVKENISYDGVTGDSLMCAWYGKVR